MLKVTLLCGAGMSTGLLATKIKIAVEKRGIQAEVRAMPYSDVDESLDVADIYLLGPQISYYRERLQKKFINTPVCVINSTDYGMMNAESVLDFLLKELEKWKK